MAHTHTNRPSDGHAQTQAFARDKVPDDAHEYHVRKGLRDAAFSGLQVMMMRGAWSELQCLLLHSRWID